MRLKLKIIGICATVVILLSVCGCMATAQGSNPSEGDTEVKSAAEAKDVALSYLREHNTQNVPSGDTIWQEQDITPPDVGGVVIKEFIAEEWTIKVSSPWHIYHVAEDTAYHVAVFNIKLGWQWKGTVKKADGTMTELSPLKQITEEASQQIALDFLKKSPTFVFDGIDGSIKLVRVEPTFGFYCWGFVYEFQCAHPGYGDRSGQTLDQVITGHEAIICVSIGEVDGGTIDKFWDVEKQSEIKPPEIGTSSIHVNPSEPIKVNAGEEFTIALEGNATTGYLWKAEWVAATIQLMNDNYQVNEGTDGKVGVGGTHYFTFRALDRCEVEITFKYQRSWENEPIDSVVYTVNVN